MKTTTYFALVLGAWAVVNAIHPSIAGERITPALEPVDERLAGSAELDAVNMSMIDRKVALSLAVEAHVQFEFLEHSLGEVSDASLKQFVETKRQFYGSLFNTLNDLTDGRAATMIDNANGDEPRPGDQAAGIKTTQVSKSGGIRAVVDNATNSTLLRVRLEIATQYAEILRAELHACRPADFDRQFMSADRINQMQAVAVLRVFEQQASDDFGKIIHQARALAENHFEDGRQLAKRLGTGEVAPPTGGLTAAQ